MLSSLTGLRRRLSAGWLIFIAIAAAGTIFLVSNLAGARSARASDMPQSAAMEDKLGIRFARVAVVGDGGLITVTYVVLDSEKALRFQTDTAHPPVLSSESRDGGSSRVSLMRQGHNLHPGQTYYLVYQNTQGAIRHKEKVNIRYGSLNLAHVAVL